MEFNNQRKAYGAALMDLGEGNPDVVVLDADLGNSTMSRQFQDKYPQRYFEMGIAEADMTSTAAGLAASGKIPFTNSFAVFSGGRAFDQIRQTIAIGKLNVKICGSSAGLSDFGDGATHQSVEDMAIMRAIPNMMVVSPDVGSVARARAFAQKLGMPLAIVDKRRQKANSSEVMNIIGDVTDKHVILLDDMVDTGGSLCHAAKALVDIGKAKSVTACATHGLLSGPAIQRIADSVIDEVVFLDTIPPKAGVAACEKIRYISVAHMFAEAISHIYEETSVSRLFS